MFIKRFLAFFVLVLTLAGCAPKADWHAEYGNAPATAPAQMQSGLYYSEYDVHRPYSPHGADVKNVSVLLPLSGPHASVGKSIGTAVEMAFMRQKYSDISVSFFDMTGNKLQKQNAILNALAAQPDVIIGPLFAEDVRLLRDKKPDNLPILSFSSDTNALGNGVMTMALIPAQSIEVIVKEMTRDGTKRFAILAPNTESGKRMGGAAILAANIHDVSVAGLFYYTEGNSESIKEVAHRASMYAARSAANTGAREILSNILIKESLTDLQKTHISDQLDKISKSDTLGKAPYDAILFLGNTSDSKNLASFLRYYDVAARDARFYGTALWDNSELLGDLTMSGSKFAALPPISPDFSELYEQLSGKSPSRLSTFGFDAANLTIGMLRSNHTNAAYLLDPSGYKGLDGLFRLRPSGESERALQIVELNGSGATRLTRVSPTNFLTPLYNVHPRQVSNASEMELASKGVNPMDYISIPENLRGKYRSKTYGANMTNAVTAQRPENSEVIIMPEDDREIFDNPDFQPIQLEQIDRQFIDSVEING